MAVQARTLESYPQLGIADEVTAAGFRLDRMHLRNHFRATSQRGVEWAATGEVTIPPPRDLGGED